MKLTLKLAVIAATLGAASLAFGQSSSATSSAAGSTSAGSASSSTGSGAGGSPLDVCHATLHKEYLAAKKDHELHDEKVDHASYAAYKATLKKIDRHGESKKHPSLAACEEARKELATFHKEALDNVKSGKGICHADVHKAADAKTADHEKHHGKLDKHPKHGKRHHELRIKHQERAKHLKKHGHTRSECDKMLKEIHAEHAEHKTMH